MRLSMFRTVPLSIIRNLFTVHSAGSGRNILILRESCLQTCMTYTIVECAVNKLLMIDGRTVRNM